MDLRGARREAGCSYGARPWKPEGEGCSAGKRGKEAPKYFKSKILENHLEDLLVEGI